MVFRTKKQKRDNGYRKLIKTKKNKKTSLSSIVIITTNNYTLIFNIQKKEKK